MRKRWVWYKKHSFLDKLIAIDEIGGLAVPKTEAIIRERLVPSHNKPRAKR